MDAAVRVEQLGPGVGVGAEAVAQHHGRAVDESVGVVRPGPDVRAVVEATPSVPSPLSALAMRGWASSSVPSTSLKASMSSRGSSATPRGMPAKPPSTKGSRRALSKPRRTVATATICPVSAPHTANTAASRGSSAQTHTDIATMLKPKPDRPCTKPAATAPSTTIPITDSMRDVLYQLR